MAFGDCRARHAPEAGLWPPDIPRLRAWPVNLTTASSPPQSHHSSRPGVPACIRLQSRHRLRTECLPIGVRQETADRLAAGEQGVDVVDHAVRQRHERPEHVLDAGAVQAGELGE